MVLLIPRVSLHYEEAGMKEVKMLQREDEGD